MREILQKCRSYLVYIGLFSLVIDLLLLVPPIYMMQTFDRVMTSHSVETLFMLTMIGLFALSTEAILEALRSRLLQHFGVALQRRLGPPVLNSILRGMQPADVTKGSLEDVRTIQAFVTGQGIKAFFAVPWIPIYLVIIYLFHPLLATIALIASLILLALTFLEEHFVAQHHKAANEAMRRAANFAQVAVQNAEVVAALGMYGAVTARWAALIQKHLTASAIASYAASSLQALAKFVRYSGPLVAMGAAAYLIVTDQSLSPGIMIASTIILGRAMAPIDQVLGAWRSFVNVREAYARLDALFHYAQQQSGAITLPKPMGELSVERLLFFIARDRHILNGINFRLAAGESLGVIGPSGSGKTSLARLLVGLHKPSDGHIRLDGAGVYTWSQQDLGQHIGYLPQQVALLPGTVAENIARMNDAESNSEQVIVAAKRARIHDMILRLPKGYATEVGEGGHLLPGGHRQLIGLARALYGDPKLVVLDEPNANLDGQSELALVDVLADLKAAGVTQIIITHKPSVIKDVDKLLVLRQGQQVLFGANQEVLRELNNLPGTGRSLEPNRAQIAGAQA